MDKYIEFNAVKFLKDAKHWEKEKEELQKQLDSITEIKGIDNSPIRSGRLHDSVADVAAEREKILNRINRGDDVWHIWQYVEKRLSDEEKSVLGVYFDGGRIDKKIYEFGRKYAMCRSDVYDLRRETLRKIWGLVQDKINVEVIVNYK